MSIYIGIFESNVFTNENSPKGGSGDLPCEKFRILELLWWLF